MRGNRRTAFVLLASLLWGGHASACQMNWNGPGDPDIVSIKAHLMTSAGGRVACRVVDHYIAELAFKLACANGSIVEIGRSPHCGRTPLSWPDCEFGLLIDKARQSFKLRENRYPEQTTCDRGLAKTILGFQLSQTTFSFEAFIEFAGREYIPKKPVGF